MKWLEGKVQEAQTRQETMQVSTSQNGKTNNLLETVKSI